MAKKNKTKQKKSSVGTQGPSQSADSYSGPIVPVTMVKEIDTGVRLLGDIATLVTTAGGVNSNVYSSDPTSMNQWANASAEWDEYRTLAIEVTHVPRNRRNQTLSVAYAASIGFTITVIDMNNTAALASGAAAAQYASAEIHSASDIVHREARAQGRNPMTYSPVGSSPTYFFAIKTFTDLCNASTDIGIYWVRRLVQFRGTT